MATTMSTGFDEHALAALPAAAPSVERQREEAFERFLALPIPSQETEEWRYTDLEELDLDLRPFAEGGQAENLDGVPEEILAGAGEVGERAGLQIQRNSEVMITHLDPALAEQGVWFGDLDRAIVGATRTRRALPARPRRDRPLEVHRTARRLPNRWNVPVRPAGRPRSSFRLQTLTWIDAEDAAIFPRTLLVADEGAEVTFIDRYARPPLGRALSDAVVEIHAGPDCAHPLRRAPGVRRGRDAPERASRARSAETRT